MIRTLLSFVTLCLSLLMGSKLIHESVGAEHPQRMRPASVMRATASPDTPLNEEEFFTSAEESVDEPTSEGDNTAPSLESPLVDSPESPTESDSAPEAKLSADNRSETPTESTNTDTSTSESKPQDKAEGSPAGKDEKPAPSEEPASTPKEAPATTPAKPLSPELIELREKVRECLGYYYVETESTVDHSPWGIMHALIAYGVDTEVIANERKVNAIGWLCWNGVCRGQQLFYLHNGKIQTRIGPGVQGHEGQFLAMMAQSKVKSKYPMRVEGKDLTLEDLIEHEKYTCEAGTELTFKLIGLAHYLDSDAEWTARSGEQWNIARLIKEELAQPVIGAACGGTHRMMGFNYAVRKREKEGKPVDGQWLRARKYLDDYFDYTFYLQNEDGSFSTDFFRGRNGYGDINRRLETSGHILEWFVASLSDEQLQDPRVIKAVTYLADLMFDNRHNEWEIGPKGHALHALAIYSERVFQDKPGQRQDVLARGRKVSHESRHR